MSLFPTRKSCGCPLNTCCMHGTEDMDELNDFEMVALPKSRETLLEEACIQLISAMEMQEKRETEEFHIPQASARAIWDEAKNNAKLLLRPR